MHSNVNQLWFRS